MRPSLRINCLGALFILVSQVAQPQDAFTPAHLEVGGVPGLPAQALSGGQVFLEVDVGQDGGVEALSPLRTTPPFTDLVISAVRQWRFEPATELARDTPAGRPPRRVSVASKVMVAAVFRPPAVYAVTLGEAPRDVARASSDVAAPVLVVDPPHAMQARDPGVVLLGARIDRIGTLADIEVVHSAPPYDDVAVETLKKWRFQPARWRNTPTWTHVYVIFGFPLPV